MGVKKLRHATLLTALVVAASAGVGAHASFAAVAAGANSAKGAKGQVFAASAYRNLVDGQKVTLTGKGYNTRIGIYVTYCVIPPKGQRPELCGPFDITGQNNASFWISSNPPLYAATLVTPFGKGGTFKVNMTATRKIGDADCALVRCAFTTRADHTRSDNRTADVFIPVSFKP